MPPKIRVCPPKHFDWVGRTHVWVGSAHPCPPLDPALQGLQVLGSWVNSTEQEVRKALAWRALNGMTSVWNSNLPRQNKLSFFYATVESVLLYGSECWTLKPALQKSLDGSYTRMLRVVLNISKTAHATNKSLYLG